MRQTNPLDRAAGAIAGAIMLVLLVATFAAPPASYATVEAPAPIIIVATPVLAQRLTAPAPTEALPVVEIAPPTPVPLAVNTPTPVPPEQPAAEIAVAAPELAEVPPAPATATPPPLPAAPADVEPTSGAIIRPAGRLVGVRERPPEKQEPRP